MTIPSERTRAVQNTARFLFALCNKHCWEMVYPLIPWPRPPVIIRQFAKVLSRHYPGRFDLEQVARKLPRDWSPPKDIPLFIPEDKPKRKAKKKP